MIERLVLSLAIVSFLHSPALAFCSYLPSKPFSVSEPSKPFCIDYSGDTSTCDGWEISQYNDAVDDYNEYVREMREYISVLKCLYDDAVDQLNNGY